jgi:hypothetical protein
MRLARMRSVRFNSTQRTLTRAGFWQRLVHDA